MLFVSGKKTMNKANFTSLKLTSNCQFETYEHHRRLVKPERDIMQNEWKFSFKNIRYQSINQIIKHSYRIKSICKFVHSTPSPSALPNNWKAFEIDIDCKWEKIKTKISRLSKKPRITTCHGPGFGSEIFISKSENRLNG